MRIALINEDSQASKNEIIYNTLKDVAGRKNHEVINFGMFDQDDKRLTYVQNGLLTAVLLNGGLVDFVVTGCGTGEGAMLACNSFPNVVCGHVTNPLDSYLFSQVNGGNAIAIPFAQNFGWGAELNLEQIFEQLFKDEFGGGYPVERREPEQANAKILDGVKEIAHKDIYYILENLDREFVKNTLDRESFKDYFFENCKDEKLVEIIRGILGSE